MKKKAKKAKRMSIKQFLKAFDRQVAATAAARAALRNGLKAASRVMPINTDACLVETVAPGWRVDTDANIRLGAACPIVAVGGRLEEQSAQRKAARRLGLTERDEAMIVRAADNDVDLNQGEPDRDDFIDPTTDITDRKAYATALKAYHQDQGEFNKVRAALLKSIKRYYGADAVRNA